jgi:hypothetical protein
MHFIFNYSVLKKNVVDQLECDLTDIWFLPLGCEFKRLSLPLLKSPLVPSPSQHCTVECLHTNMLKIPPQMFAFDLLTLFVCTLASIFDLVYQVGSELKTRRLLAK